MKVAVITASFGGCTPIAAMMTQHVPNGVEVSFHPLTDAQYPPRPCAMHPRMLAKIPKVWGWQIVPGYDVYIWLDAQLAFKDNLGVSWLLHYLDKADIAVFKHPFRKTVRDEARFIREELPRSKRLMQRYQGEWLDAQLAAISKKPDDNLYAAGTFIYRPTNVIQTAMMLWWIHITRFHINDQLSFPYVLWKSGAMVNEIDENIFHSSHLRYRPRGD